VPDKISDVMMVPDWDKSERGRQRRMSNGRLLHCCCICGHLDVWSGGWSYFGSLKELDEGTPVPKFCSEECRSRGGIHAGRVTTKMKEKAKAAEWRDPTIAYRPATEREKYAAALRRQKPLHPRNDTHGH
jgi:hypothetical protein